MNESNDIKKGKKMYSLSANEAKTQFGNVLLKTQSEPVQINKNGKPVAVIISVDEYASMDMLKRQFLQLRAAQARIDIEAGRTVDGDAFFNALETGQFK